jgi:hypothetical protein
VDVEVTCRVATGDLVGLQAPGNATTSATARAPIETFVEISLWFDNSEAPSATNRSGGGL